MTKDWDYPRPPGAPFRPAPPLDRTYELNPGPPPWVSMVGIVFWVGFVAGLAFLIVGS